MTKLYQFIYDHGTGFSLIYSCKLIIIVYVYLHVAMYVYVDGHHKLIRWRLVTHGGIDGYSQMIVYLKCSNNNSG